MVVANIDVGRLISNPVVKLSSQIFRLHFCQMLSAFPSSLSRHSLSRQALKQHHLPASTLFISTSLKNAVSEVPPRALLAPSSSDFASLAGKGVFVDKSSALRDFLQEDYPIHLLLRPRRSGKTTLLRMFR